MKWCNFYDDFLFWVLYVRLYELMILVLYLCIGKKEKKKVGFCFLGVFKRKFKKK